MIKKIAKTVTLLLILCLFSISVNYVHATDEIAKVRLYDFVNSMSEQEYAELHGKIREFTASSQIDLLYGVLGQGDDYDLPGLKELCYKLYDEFKFGVNDTRDCAVILYAPATGHYCIQSFGSDDFILTFDQKISEIQEDMLKYLNQNDTYNAGLSIVENMSELSASNLFGDLSKRVYDEADKLNDQEEKDLEELIKTLQEKHKIDIVYILLGDAHVFSNMEIHDFGKELYEKGDFGINDTKDTAMLVMSTSNRKYEVLSFGKESFQKNMDKYFEKIKGAFIGEVNDNKNDYYNGGVKFAHSAIEYSNLSYLKKVKMLLRGWITPVIGLVLSVVVLLVILSSHKGTIDVNDMTYEREGSYSLNRVSDSFKYSRVDKTRKSKDNGSGGGSGGSNSSGGGSY